MLGPRRFGRSRFQRNAKGGTVELLEQIAGSRGRGAWHEAQRYGAETWRRRPRRWEVCEPWAWIVLPRARPDSAEGRDRSLAWADLPHRAVRQLIHGTIFRRRRVTLRIPTRAGSMRPRPIDRPQRFIAGWAIKRSPPIPLPSCIAPHCGSSPIKPGASAKCASTVANRARK